MALPPVLASIIGWLRAGYPEGVPQQAASLFLATIDRKPISITATMATPSAPRGTSGRRRAATPRAPGEPTQPPGALGNRQRETATGRCQARSLRSTRTACRVRGRASAAADSATARCHTACDQLG